MKTLFRLFTLISFSIILLASCNSKKQNESENTVPTEEEKAQAVKDVLKQGLEKATKVLSAENGFLNNDSLKITLPAEAKGLINNIKRLPQGEELLNKAITQINQAAGSSVDAIAPIISAAIDNMSVEDANKILSADDAAATAYLEKLTREPLHTACEPVILKSLDKKIIGDITARSTWMNVAGAYNKMANTSVGKLASMEPVELNLDGYVTDKMLDAVFYLIAKEEMNIREHPGARISKSVAKSFGWIDDNNK